MTRINLFQLTNKLLLSLLPATCAWSVTPIDLRHNALPLSQLLSSKPASRLTSTPSTNTNSSFKTISTYTDFKKTDHKRLKQMYDGYPVWGAEIVVHTSKNPTASLLKGPSIHFNGLMYQDLNQELESPPAKSIMKEQEDRALNQVIRHLKEGKTVSTDIIKSKASRIVFVDHQNKAHWAYYIELVAKQDGSLSQTAYIIDATTNELYSSWNNLHTIADSLTFVQGGGYGGNKYIGYKTYENNTKFSSFHITREDESGTCFLQGMAGNKNLWDEVLFAVNNVSDMDHAFPVKYSCLDKNSSHGDLYWNDDLHASVDNDAFYHANITNNMYIDWFQSLAVLNTGSSDEQTLPVQIYTHWNNSNAFWIGVINGIFLGDGTEESGMHPFTSLDVVAHELSHGFTEHHAQLVYKDQSGGLNESFSDMAAVAASYYMNNESNWNIGTEISADGQPLRYIDNPRRDCVGKSPYIKVEGYKIRQCSIDHIKDFQEGTAGIEGIPFVDVHLSSGIFNKAFYLISQGFGGDKQQGTQKAFNVMVQANRGYWTPNTSFQEAACGVMEATHDYGYDETVVVKAMSSVGIDVKKC